ncbi:hypothetical protein FFLO_02392 [Filobasidium floriforme]|uniref:Vacuolar protein sorting 55 n=1 Tax=Filobasidium floriforme TaxID=5210 RepID=A0A8K0JNF8_9TREE|nr:vacuolar protein sorting 55 [Filobasidium floriforme]KAG7562207.1 hypothetical protein FFLO_02392 [Filobasidium floriforme]KAH8088284.1 vacuolar protein sorting 55 [Filobasidium floriforme]
MFSAGLKTVVGLAFVLAMGFLLVILSCALWANWLPLLVAATFVIAPIPNSLCSRFAGADDISPEYNSSYTDFGHFLTGMLVVAGFAEPLLFSHANLVEPAACWMSMIGGGLIYGTILTYSGLFDEGKGYDF